MTSPSKIPPLRPKELADYGHARARDVAFNAVQALWRRRAASGMKQLDVAKAIDRDPAWVSKNLRGPGNWTLRTLGELVEALNGELEISVYGLEDPVPVRSNFHAYADYEPTAPAPTRTLTATTTPPNSLRLILDRALLGSNAAAIK